ncbi:hypothetical protein EJB05_54813, partial [Eragrostis curvula]
MNTCTIPMARCAGGINTATAVGRSRSHVKVMAAVADRASSFCSVKSSDYYKVLSLEHSPAVGAEEIKRAYRRLALQCHPDVCPPSRRAESTEFFLEVRRAYETLSDPAQKLRYDAELRTGGAARRSRDEFARDVWEAQLSVLRARSERRQRASRVGRRHGMAHA